MSQITPNLPWLILNQIICQDLSFVKIFLAPWNLAAMINTKCIIRRENVLQWDFSLCVFRNWCQGPIIPIYSQSIAWRRNVYVCYDFISSITTKILLLSSCYILLLTTRNQPIIQEETVEGREIVFLNYITFFFFSLAEVPLEDSCIF